MTADERQEKLSGLVERYRVGEFSDDVFIASILRLVPDRDERRYLIHQNYEANRQAIRFKPGTRA